MRHLLAASLLLGGLAQPLLAEDCPELGAPVVSVSHGSRYTADSKTRSDFDAEGEKEIEEALGPIDQFIIELAKLANTSLRAAQDEDTEKATFAADCVLDAIATWAKANALAELGTVSAKLSVPSRLGGIAFAYATVLPHGTVDAARDQVIGDWLRLRAEDTMAFFDGDEVPPRASRNNLRGWAALAVTRIGLSVDDPALILWGEDSIRETLCSANPDGSLPLEMERGPLSLHYQIHALTPIVVTAALLAPKGSTLISDCEGAMGRIVDFTLTAVEDPALVTPLAGKQQRFKAGVANLKPSEAAWLLPWQVLSPSDETQALIDGFEILANSKLGGDLSLTWKID